MARLPQELKDQIYEHMIANTFTLPGIEADIMDPAFADLKSLLLTNKCIHAHTKQAMRQKTYFKAVCNTLEDAQEASKKARIIFETFAPASLDVRRMEVTLLHQKYNGKAWWKNYPRPIQSIQPSRMARRLYRPLRCTFNIEMPETLNGLARQPFVPDMIWAPRVYDHQRVWMVGLHRDNIDSDFD